MADLGPHRPRRWVGRDRLLKLMSEPAVPALLDDEGDTRHVRPDQRRSRRTRAVSAGWGFIEAEFDPIPIDVEIGREWGALASLCVARGLQPRRRAMDLLIAATARALDLPLITLDQDLVPLADVLDVRSRTD